MVTKAAVTAFVLDLVVEKRHGAQLAIALDGHLHHKCRTDLQQGGRKALRYWVSAFIRGSIWVR
ncbi:MAG: hypothetical protein IPK27_07025 [Rhodanobacteraceae bacterium]|nr:hypothetical protein [Rhodanobacteraceae bacterium]